MTAEKPKQDPIMILQKASILMLVELLLELKESQPELALRVAKRFHALENNDLAQDSPDSMEFIRLVAKEIEGE